MNSKTYFGRLVIVTIFAISLSACGFHLRGSIPLPSGIKNMFLEAPQGSFKAQLESVIPNAGGVLASNKAAGDVVLSIKKAATTRTVGTLDARGKADSYNLIFTVKYSLQDPEGKVIRKTTLKETRRYNFDPLQVVESESEETDLLSDMERQIALRMVRQLVSVTDYPPKDGDGSEE